MRKNGRTRVVLAVLFALTAFGVSAQKEADAEKSGRVKASLAMSLDQIEVGQDVRIWIVIENGLDSDIAGLAFDEFETPGFTKSACWENGAPACQGSSTTPTQLTALKAHDSVVLWAMLTRDGSLSNGQKILLASSFHWTEPATGSVPA